MIRVKKIVFQRKNTTVIIGFYYRSLTILQVVVTPSIRPGRFVGSLVRFLWCMTDVLRLRPVVSELSTWTSTTRKIVRIQGLSRVLLTPLYKRFSHEFSSDLICVRWGGELDKLYNQWNRESWAKKSIFYSSLHRPTSTSRKSRLNDSKNIGLDDTSFVSSSIFSVHRILKFQLLNISNDTR